MEERELTLPSKKERKKKKQQQQQQKTTKSHLMNEAGKDKLLNPLLITLACCLMMARRLHVCEMDLKFATHRKIMLKIMTSFYKSVHLSKRLTVVIAFA